MTTKKMYAVVEKAKIEMTYTYEAHSPEEAEEKYRAAEEAVSSWQSGFSISDWEVREAKRDEM